MWLAHRTLLLPRGTTNLCERRAARTARTSGWMLKCYFVRLIGEQLQPNARRRIRTEHRLPEPRA
jgi:hypothetical protein